MEWLIQNWPLLLIGGALLWLMFGRRAGQGGGCCGGGASVRQDSTKTDESRSKPAQTAAPPRPAAPQ